MSSYRVRAACLVGACLLPAAITAGAAETTYVGRDVYKTYCSSCHGPDAKGDGPLASSLRVRPPDLTLIGKRMGGTFSSDKVRRIIDGRDPVKGHGGADMPVWGDAFKSSRDGYSEQAVKARIDALTEHLAGKLMEQGEMSLKEALHEIRAFEAACFSFDTKVGLNGAPNNAEPAPDAAA